MTPGVSILERGVRGDVISSKKFRHLRLTLEVLHDVQEPIIHIRLINELNFDLIEIAQSILADSVLSAILHLDGHQSKQDRETYIKDGLLALHDASGLASLHRTCRSVTRERHRLLLWLRCLRRDLLQSSRSTFAGRNGSAEDISRSVRTGPESRRRWTRARSTTCTSTDAR